MPTRIEEVNTRRLIVTAVVCGVVIVAAFAVQFVQLNG